MMNNEKIERVHVLYTGRVQGVGFRFTTHQIAQQFPITGYVRNCPDGSVELVAEGTYEEILNFLHAVRNSYVGRYIIDEKFQWFEATGEFKTFKIVI